MSERRIAVITGGTKGIGRAIAEIFLADGFKVYTSARTDVDENVPKDFIIYKADLSKKEEVRGFAKFISYQENHINILVNNVGTYIPGGIISEEDGAFEHMMDTNLASTYHMTRALINLIRKGKHPYIFNICSTASVVPYVNGGSYCISKHAQLGLTKVLRQELMPDKIRVSAVLPGATLTSSWSGTDLPKERFIDPKSVAQLIKAAYQLSDFSVMEEILIRPMEGDIT